MSEEAELYSRIAEAPYDLYGGEDVEEINSFLPEDYRILENEVPLPNEPQDNLLMYSPSKNELVFVIKGTSLNNPKEVLRDIDVLSNSVAERQVFRTGLAQKDDRHGTLVQTAKEFNKKKGNIDLDPFQEEVIRLHNILADFVSENKLDKLRELDRPKIKIVSHSLGGAKGLGVQEALRTIDFGDKAFEEETDINIYYKPYKIPNLFDVEHISFAPLTYPSHPETNDYYFLNGLRQYADGEGNFYDHQPMGFRVYSTGEDLVVQDERFFSIANLLSRGRTQAIKGKGDYEYILLPKKEITGHSLSNFYTMRDEDPKTKKVISSQDFQSLLNPKVKRGILVGGETIPLIAPQGKLEERPAVLGFEVFDERKVNRQNLMDLQIKQSGERPKRIRRPKPLKVKIPMKKSPPIQMFDDSLSTYCKYNPKALICLEEDYSLSIDV